MNLIERGVYLGMPHDDYLAEQSLSTSGIKALLASPLTYWTRFFGPDREDHTTPAKELGRAIHKMILEGKGAFFNEFMEALKLEDFPGCLQGVKTLQERCGSLGLKKSGTLEEMADRILDVDPNAVLWPVIMRNFDAMVARNRKQVVKNEVVDQCERILKAVEANKAVHDAFTGGIPEVSVFWTNDAGIPLKARFDYLKPQAIVDLKSFSNSMDAPLDEAIAKAVINRMYHLQALVYLDAFSQAKSLIRAGLLFGEGVEPLRASLDTFAQSKRHPQMFFVFAETGPATNVVIREIKASTHLSRSVLWDTAQKKVKRALDTWNSFMGTLGPDQPWYDCQPARAFFDEEFPLYGME
ncbi:MAG: PD-(D/E)XK nuclease-like domain-containing protein [Magnetococcales bacterium]|nr:PD-(D/E)XK nuclease-like domain-containing protein [Magnetococcales bacterium]